METCRRRALRFFIPIKLVGVVRQQCSCYLCEIECSPLTDGIHGLRRNRGIAVIIQCNISIFIQCQNRDNPQFFRCPGSLLQSKFIYKNLKYRRRPFTGRDLRKAGRNIVIDRPVNPAQIRTSTFGTSFLQGRCLIELSIEALLYIVRKEVIRRLAALFFRNYFLSFRRGRHNSTKDEVAIDFILRFSCCSIFIHYRSIFIF